MLFVVYFFRCAKFFSTSHLLLPASLFPGRCCCCFPISVEFTNLISFWCFQEVLFNLLWDESSSFWWFLDIIRAKTSINRKWALELWIKLYILKILQSNFIEKWSSFSKTPYLREHKSIFLKTFFSTFHFPSSLPIQSADRIERRSTSSFLGVLSRARKEGTQRQGGEKKLKVYVEPHVRGGGSRARTISLKLIHSVFFRSLWDWKLKHQKKRISSLHSSER